MTKEEIQEGYYKNCIVEKNVPEHLRCPSGYTHDGWFQGARWAQEELITRTCHALEKVLSQQMLAELVKVMKGE